MRTLHSDLLTAQKQSSAVPYVRVQVSERTGGVARLVWERLYSGSESDSYHAAAIPADGALLRARVDSGQLYYQRTTSPGPGSSFGTWTGLGATADAGIALAAEGTRVLLFYVGTDGRTIYLRESSDSGQTLGAATALVTAPAAVTWLASGLKSDGTALLLYSVGADVYSLKRSSGIWGMPQPWSNSVAAVTGLACHYFGDFNVLVAGSDSSGASRLWTCIYGDGLSQATDTWSELREVMLASPGSSVGYRAPFLTLVDTYRLFAVEKYTASQSYSRPYWSHSAPASDFIDNLWREPIPFDLTSEYGVALAADATHAWLSTPYGVWHAPFGAPSVDLTADVLELTLTEDAVSNRGRLVLRNDDGRYLNLPSGPYAAIRLGSEVAVAPGYQTASGPRVSSGPAYWIEGIEYTSDGGEAALVLHLIGGWGLLERWRARRQYAWSSGERNVFQILQFVLARAGLSLTTTGPPSSDALGSHSPAFTIHPSESGAATVRRLLAMVPERLFFAGGQAVLKNPLASEASVYAYGTDHALLRGRYQRVPHAANRVQVFGEGLVIEGMEWSEVDLVYDRLRQVHDRNLATTAAAQERLDAELRRLAIAAVDAAITVPVNCGQELYDVVQISDSRAGLSATPRRVLGIELRYVATSGRRQPVYQQRLTLGLP